MIQNTETENLTGFGQLVMYAPVGLARLEIAGWVVVRENHGSGPVGDDIGEDLARVYRAFVE